MEYQITDDMEFDEDWKPEFPILQSASEKNAKTGSCSNDIISPDSMKIKSETSEIYSDNIIPYVEVKIEDPEEITETVDTNLEVHKFEIDPLKVENDASEEPSDDNNFDDYQIQSG